jgi:hypothetical protein
LRTANFYTRLYNRSLRTGLAIISPGVVNPKLPMAKSLRTTETAVNNWYQNEKIAGKNMTQLFHKAVDQGSSVIRS